MPQKQKEGMEALSNKEKFEVVLKLFGSPSARDSFIETCKRYIEEKGTSLPDAYASNDAENYRPMKARYSPPKQSLLHNRIMETLQHLSMQKLPPLQEKVLNEMGSREVAGQIIKDWVLAQGEKTQKANLSDDE